MAYSYIYDFCPRDWGLYTLGAYPYQEGVRNLSIGFPCFDPPTNETPPSVIGRIAHIILGLSLVLPVINTIVFIALRFFGNHTIFEDEIKILDIINNESPRIDELNNERFRLSSEIAEAQREFEQLDQKDKVEELQQRSKKLSKDKSEIEEEAISLMVHHDCPEVEEHWTKSQRKDPELIKLDGQIRGQNGRVTLIINDKHIPGGSATFEQLPGLSQGKADNFLCGQYALDSMKKMIIGEELCDRDGFNRFFPESQSQILLKRSLVRFAKEKFPYGIKLPTHSLHEDDFQYLIENCRALEAIRNTRGCLLLELDKYYNPDLGKKVYSMQLLGKSRKEKESTLSFPLHIILKGKKDYHFYYIFAETPNSFKVVDSLNSSLSAGRLNSHICGKIINALFVKLGLKFNWNSEAPETPVQ